MPNEITPETLREWADEADEGEDVVLGSRELHQLANQLDDARRHNDRLRKALDEALERAG